MQSQCIHCQRINIFNLQDNEVLGRHTEYKNILSREIVNACRRISDLSELAYKLHIQTKNSCPSYPILPIGRIVQFAVFTETNPSYKTTHQMAEEISLRVADEVQPSIMQRLFYESSKQDFAIISEVCQTPLTLNSNLLPKLNHVIK
jgi:hypothetical protein